MTEHDNALDIIEKALSAHAFVTKVEATDGAFSERSVVMKFTVDESADLFESLRGILTKRKNKKAGGAPIP